MIKSFVTDDWVVMALVLLMGLIAFLHFLNEKRFTRLISIVKMNEYFVDYNHKKAPFVSVFNGLLLIYQLGIYALFIISIQAYFNTSTLLLTAYTIVFLKLFVFLIIKYLFVRLIAYIFELNKIYDVLSFIKFTYLLKIAIYITPLLILVLKMPFFKMNTLYITIAITAFLFLFFYVRLLIQNQKLLFNNFVYFILYFCILEIIPLVYLFQMINSFDWL